MSEHYDEYLEAHTAAVRKAAAWMQVNLEVMRELTEEEVEQLNKNVNDHDLSKYGPQEYDAYDDWFYGSASERDGDAFDRAWLHHIHHNPHHWQHWVLINDDGRPGEYTALEMPRQYVFEMVADWWSFSWRTGNLNEIFGWYKTHEGRIVMHENTKALLHRILDEIREKTQP